MGLELVHYKIIIFYFNTVMWSWRTTFKKSYLLCFFRNHSLIANSKIKTKYKNVHKSHQCLSCWPLCEKKLFQCHKTVKVWYKTSPFPLKSQLTTIKNSSQQVLTWPYSSRSPFPSSSVTKFPAGVLCKDNRPFFDLLLGSATGSLKTLTWNRNREKWWTSSTSLKTRIPLAAKAFTCRLAGSLGRTSFYFIYLPIVLQVNFIPQVTH